MKAKTLADKELWEQLSAEDDRFHERMKSYEELPVKERLEKFREEIRDAESKILEITGDPYKEYVSKSCDSEDKREIVENLLGFRGFALSKMFEIHCSEAEVTRIESLNAKLYALTQQMFERTGRMYRYILDMPLDEKDDDIEVEGTLRYWSDARSGILHLEDDDFYSSDFQRMIPIIAFIESECHGDLPFISCDPYWRRDSGHRSSMSDKELGVDNFLDDGQTWAESWLYHPKLNHIVMCYVTHAIVTHNHYSIPDFMRLNDFEIKVEMKLQQFSEQDGSRMWWWDGCGERQFIDKFLHEAEHRPSGMSLGEFVYMRGIEYFDIEGSDESDALVKERMIKTAVETKSAPSPEEIERLYPGNRMRTLPDCRKDDGKVEEFLTELYSMAKRR